MSTMNMSLSKFLDDKKNMVLELQKKLIDPSIDLDERWQIFHEMTENNLLDCETYGNGFIDTLGSNLTLYDDFYCERHETLKYTDMLDKIHEANVDDADAFPSHKVNEWMEKVLASGYQEFINDW